MTVGDLSDLMRAYPSRINNLACGLQDAVSLVKEADPTVLRTIPGTSDPKNEKEACINTAQNPRNRPREPCMLTYWAKGALSFHFDTPMGLTERIYH